MWCRMRTSRQLQDHAPTFEMLLPFVNMCLANNGSQPPVTPEEQRLYEEFYDTLDTRSVTPPIEDLERLKFN
jgi:hypothetical protein